jgi:hypothetical protein
MFNVVLISQQKLLKTYMVLKVEGIKILIL